MADETTQPIIAVQPTQPKKLFNTETTTLKGNEVYGRMKAFSGNARDYKSASMSGEQYYLYRYAGTMITVPSTFHLAFEAKEILEITLTGSSRMVEVTDPNNPAGKKLDEIQSYGLDSWLTINDDVALLRLQKHKKTMERAVKTIQKIDVSKELTDVELNALLDEA